MVATKKQPHVHVWS